MHRPPRDSIFLIIFFSVFRESNAILVYLIEKYDTEKKLSVEGDDKHKLNQWLSFQSSGQGYASHVLFVVSYKPKAPFFSRPYFGQYTWFKLYHPERIASAVERYKKEIARVWGVLDSVLSKQEWLVGGKVTIADLSFIT